MTTYMCKECSEMFWHDHLHKKSCKYKGPVAYHQCRVGSYTTMNGDGFIPEEHPEIPKGYFDKKWIDADLEYIGYRSAYLFDVGKFEYFGDAVREAIKELEESYV